MIRLSDTLEWIRADFEAGLLTLDEAFDKVYDAGYEWCLEQYSHIIASAYDEED